MSTAVTDAFRLAGTRTETTKSPSGARSECGTAYTTPIPVPLSDTKYDPDQQVLVVADGQPCAKIERAGTMRVTYPDGQKPGQSDVEKD